MSGECLKLLVSDPAFDHIVVVTRRPLPDYPGPLVPRSAGPPAEVHIVDFDRLTDHASRFRVDAILCALGTTIRQAGSQESFRKVDYEYPVALARLGLAQGAKHFLLVSALGANPRSWVFYKQRHHRPSVAPPRQALRIPPRRRSRQAARLPDTREVQADPGSGHRPRHSERGEGRPAGSPDHPVLRNAVDVTAGQPVWQSGEHHATFAAFHLPRTDP